MSTIEEALKILNTPEAEGGLADHEKILATRNVLLAAPLDQPDTFTLVDAVRNLYYAAVWHADRPVDEAGLWTAVRDAAGFEPGQSPVEVEEAFKFLNTPVRRDVTEMTLEEIEAEYEADYGIKGKATRNSDGTVIVEPRCEHTDETLLPLQQEGR